MMADSQLLNWCESQATPGLKWVARWSTLGRGFRVHQVTEDDLRWMDREIAGDTMREAIMLAVAHKLEMERRHAASKLMEKPR